jgi:CO/xanthine dehydrogenase Mo-binding subunit
MAKRFVTTKVEVEGREETKVVELPTRDPEPWGNDASLHVVGRREKRMDALEKVTGEAEYTADVQLPGMLYVALKRANVAAGRITTLDLAPALAQPGVRGGLATGDLQGIKLDGIQLFDGTIHYANQPIAAICADTLEIAERALREIRVEVEPMPHAIDAASALADDAPRVKPHGNTHTARLRVSRAAVISRPGCATPTSRSCASTARRSRCTRPSSRTAQ